MTVAFPQLGAFGRLGNQLFQIAATIRHATIHNTEPLFPIWERLHMFPMIPERWFRRTVPFAGSPYEAPWNFAPVPYWEDMALHGYFQSPRFFNESFDIISMLRPRSMACYRPQICSVHVRRCDYLQIQQHHPTIPMEWYERAMEKARSNGATGFRVMSDDPLWCEQQPQFKGCAISFDTELLDLGRAAECGHHIICNSTFGWWAAFLSGEGSVIMPSPWFGPALADHDEKQLHVNGWEILPWQPKT